MTLDTAAQPAALAEIQGGGGNRFHPSAYNVM